MSSTRSLSAIALAAAVLLSPLFTARAAAQEDEFRRGLDAIDDENWAAAADMMRQAIAKRPQESTNRVRRGFERLNPGAGTEYLPYYFLGRALFETNDCAGATATWAISVGQKVVTGLPALSRVIQDGYAECERRGILPPDKYDAAIQNASQQLNDINALAKRVTGAGQANLDVWRADSAMREQYDRAVAEIGNANKSYTSARTSRAQKDLADAGAAIERARASLTAIEARLASAIDNVRSAQSLAAEVAAAIAAAEGLNRTLEGKKVPFTPAMTAAFQEGRDGISRANERLKDGARTLDNSTLLSARTLAVDATTRLRQLLDDVNGIEKELAQRQFGETVTRAFDSFTLLDTAVATLERFSAQRPGVLPADQQAERAAVERDVAQARRRFEAARKAENAAGVAAAEQLAVAARDRLNLLIAAFGPLTLRDRGVHAVLEEGAALFLAGEYEQAAASLASAESLDTDVPLRLHAHLFRSAALYALFLRSGEADQALRAQAVAEDEHCKAIDSTFVPDATAFSPRFRAFYESVPVTLASAPPPAAQP